MKNGLLYKSIWYNIYLTDADLTKSGKIKNQTILDLCEDMLRQCREACNEIGFTVRTIPIADLMEKIRAHLSGRKFQLDFIAFTESCITKMPAGTAQVYKATVSALKRFTKRETLSIDDITVAFLKQFREFLETEPSRQGDNRKAHKEPENFKPRRKVSAYLSAVRKIHNLAKETYNEEDIGLVRIPNSPFARFKIPKDAPTRKRALSETEIQSIIDLPHADETGGDKWTLFNLAKDCFLMSFALIGMNSADLYFANMMNDRVITYNRQKTHNRRADNAEMRVMVEPCISAILEKYADDERQFAFYKHYSDIKCFNKALNTGLKQIGEALGIYDLEYYAARHSWATIACSSAVGVDKYTVHEALNHSDQKMRITDIYIARDWTVIWNANRKVLAQFDWTLAGF